MIPKTQHLTKLISQNENLNLLARIGERRQILANTIAEVYLTKQPRHDFWVQKTTGILCFVKDFCVRSYFFEVFDLKTYTKLWSEELYVSLEYSEATGFFHVFEGVDYNVGFNFSDEREANFFAACVLNLTKRRSSTYALENQPREIKVVPVQRSTENVERINHMPTPNGTLLSKKKTFTKKDLKKLKIGKPLNFQHMAHMPSKSTEEAFNYNPELMALFKKVKYAATIRRARPVVTPILFTKKPRISERQLRDPATKSILDQVVMEKSEQIDEIIKNAAPQSKLNNRQLYNRSLTVDTSRITTSHNPPHNSKAYNSPNISPSHNNPHISPSYNAPSIASSHNTTRVSRTHSTSRNHSTARAQSTPRIAPSHNSPSTSSSHNSPRISPSYNTPGISPSHNTPRLSRTHSTSRSHSTRAQSTPRIPPSHNASSISPSHYTPPISPSHNAPRALRTQSTSRTHRISPPHNTTSQNSPRISPPVIFDEESNKFDDNYGSGDKPPAPPTPPSLQGFEEFCRERANNITITKKTEVKVQPTNGTTDLMDAIRRAIDVRYLAIQRDDDMDDEWDA